MLYVVLVVLLLALLFGPQLWVQYVLRKYNTPQPHIPGTGGELAQHLISRFGLEGVGVEQADKRGDHYDPQARMVRLSADYINTASLTAVAIAAHEVGHAIQHHRQEPLLQLRTRLAQIAISAQKLSGALLLVIPFAVAISRAPSAGIGLFLIGLASMVLGVLVQLATLPVEIDASFNKALPILRQGRYIDDKDLKNITKILRAAAFTYLASSLAGILNLGRWIILLKK